ncbi:hypothetical protein B0H34DRAFT_677156 [Crassisporium funariophilum]|nr:hypothetical protein B0H34DRAFT_677156 [Crassisporium funariophilum]
MSSPILSGPPIGPPPIPHDALVRQKQGQAVMIWAIGALVDQHFTRVVSDVNPLKHSFCIFGWEWLLCLPQEYKRIWKKPMNLTDILEYSRMFFWEPVGALISTVLSQMILGSRVYAIFSQNKGIGFVLALTLLVEIVVGGISVSTTSPPPVTPGPPGSKPPCGAVMGPFGWLLAFWLTQFDSVIGTRLTAYKAYEYYKREVNTPLFNIIFRDGMLYFFVIFSMNLTNVIIFLTVPKSLRAINLTPTLILEVVLSCRMILNLRETHGRSASQPPLLNSGSGPKWSDTSRSRMHPLNDGPAEQYESTELNSFHAPQMKLEPIRRAPVTGPIDIKVNSSWNAV